MSLSSVCHPQTNGQVESSNKNILESLKKRLDDAKGLWIEELPSTLWAIRTTTHSRTRDTPFNLAFESDVVIPVEIGINSLRIAHYDWAKWSKLTCQSGPFQRNTKRGQCESCCKAKNSGSILQQTSQGQNIRRMRFGFKELPSQSINWRAKETISHLGRPLFSIFCNWKWGL